MLSTFYGERICRTYVGTDGKIYHQSTPSSLATAASTFLFDDTWTQIVVSKSSTNGVKIYQDGTLVASNGTYTTNNATNAGTYNTLGAGNDRTSFNMSGEIDEVSVFDVELTADNVTFLYNAGSPGADEQYPFPVAPTSTDCVTYLKCETDATDSTGNLDFTASGAVLTTGSGGIIGECYDFDGINDNLTSGSNNYPDPSFWLSDYSISFWMRPDTIKSSAILAYPGYDINIQLDHPTANDKLMLQHFDGATAYRKYSTSTFSAATWYHVVVTREQGVGVKFYVNGALDSTSTDVTNAISSVEDTTWGSQAGTKFFDGKMDEMSVFDVTLTANEVAYLYNAGSPGSVQQYPFSGATPTVRGVKLATTLINSVKLGSTTVNLIYLGTTKIFEN